MAIGPEQLQDSFKEDLIEFEAIIDRNLRNSSFINGSKIISITAPRGMEDAHFNILKMNYLKAGWKSVRREYGHQRDPLNEIIFEKL